MAKFDGAQLLSISVRIYRALMIAYPRSFRHAYAADMVQLFADLGRETLQCHGASGLVRLWLRTVADLLTSAVYQRASSLAQRTPRLNVRVALMLLAVGTIFEFARLYH